MKKFLVLLEGLLLIAMTGAWLYMFASQHEKISDFNMELTISELNEVGLSESQVAAITRAMAREERATGAFVFRMAGVGASLAILLYVNVSKKLNNRSQPKVGQVASETKAIKPPDVLSS